MATTQALQSREYTSLERAVYAKAFRLELSKILGSNPDDLDSFTTEVFNQARKVPDLHECTIDSIRFHLLRVAQLRLNPALPNEVFFIPRNQKQPDGQYAMELTIQYGYGGLRKLVMRSPDVLDVLTKEVCINDTFEPPLSLIHLPVHQLPRAFHPRGRVIGYYAAAQVRGGNWRTVLMSVAEVQAHVKLYVRNPGPAWQKGIRPALDDGLCPFDKQALKTCLRMLCNGRDIPLHAEVQTALALEAAQEQAPTNAERQGYAKDGTRPALTLGTGTPMDELLQDLGGATDKDAIAVQVAQETRRRDGMSPRDAQAIAADLVPQIEAAILTTGIALDVYWPWAIKRCGRTSQAALTGEDYQLLLRLAREQPTVEHVDPETGEVLPCDDAERMRLDGEVADGK